MRKLLRKMLTFQGLSQVELLLVIGITAILLSFTTINLAGSQRKANLSSEANKFIADLKEQQIKAMVGEGDGAGGGASDYGIRFATTSYTLFRGSYGASNFVVNLPTSIQFSPLQPDIVFAKGGGNISSSTVITIRNTATGEQKAITINKYGVVTAVN